MARLGSRIALGLVAAAVAGVAAAEGSPVQIGVAGGTGNNVNVFGLQAAWAPPLDVPSLQRHAVEARVLGQFEYWGAHDHPDNRSLVDAGALAALHWTMAPASEYKPYLEPALGIELLSHVKINGRDFTTAFQFGSQLAAGIVIPRCCEVAAFVHHTSNGDIKLPNWGLSYAGLMLRVALP